MLGILVWFDERLQSGIVWCEDQGALAFLDARVAAEAGFALREGDLIDIEVSDSADHRRVERIAAMRQAGGGARLRALLDERVRAQSGARADQPALKVVA